MHSQDSLEEVLHSYRSAAREKNKSLLTEKCEDVIALNVELKKLRAQTGIGNDIGEEDAVIGPGATGPKEEVDNGPNKDANNGPKEDADNDAEPKDAEDAGIMSTPSQQRFETLSHWIRSSKSSSGYKGVFKDNGRRGWRAKPAGSTIGRYPSLGQACEAYYNYCKRECLL